MTSFTSGALVYLVDNNPMYKDTHLQGTIKIYQSGAPGYVTKNITEKEIVMFLWTEDCVDQESNFTKIYIIYDGKIYYTYKNYTQKLEKFMRPALPRNRLL